MTQWKRVPRPTDPTRGTVAIRRYDENRRSLCVSSDLCTASRATILTDGNGKLAIHFSEDGDVSVVRQSQMRRIALRKMADNMIPVGFYGLVPWHREDGMIVIDTTELRR